MGHKIAHGTEWWAGKRTLRVVSSFHQVIWRQGDWPVGADGVNRKPQEPQVDKHREVFDRVSLQAEGQELEEALPQPARSSQKRSNPF